MRKALFLLLLTACGDNREESISFDELATLANNARCSRLVRCGLFADEGSCRVFFRRDPQVNLRAAIERGVVDFDGASAKQCQEALALLGCSDLQRDARVLPDACRRAFRGTRADGATCAIDEECESGYCEGPGCPEGQCCTGICAPQRFAELDEACETDLDCQDDLKCTGSRCRPLVAIGGECQSDRQCDYGLACIGANEFMPGNCRQMPLLGESCPYLRCAEIGASCEGGTCRPLGLPGDSCDGAPCNAFSACVAQQCVALPSLGEACTDRCAGESWCDAGTCAAPLADGAMCTAGGQCASLVCVDGPVYETCKPSPVCIP